MNVFTKEKSIPKVAIMEVPKHNMSQLIARYSAEGYLSSPAGIAAMQRGVALSEDLKFLEVFHLRYKSSMALEPFEAFFSEHIDRAVEEQERLEEFVARTQPVAEKMKA